MTSARKKVILRRTTGEVLPGYLSLSGFTHGTGNTRTVELLDLSARLVQVPLAGIQMISYVRDFNLSDSLNPERLTRRSFLARPRNEGMWLRMTFRPLERFPDRPPEILEGLAASDISLFDSLIDDGGLHFTPPDIQSNCQRIFVPRCALETVQILAVITTPSRVKPTPSRTAEDMRKKMQESLFDALTPGNVRPN